MSTKISAVFESADLADLALKHLKDHHIPILKRRMYPDRETEGDVFAAEDPDSKRGVERGVDWLSPYNSVTDMHTDLRGQNENAQGEKRETYMGVTVLEITVNDRHTVSAGRMLTSVHGKQVKVLS